VSIEEIVIWDYLIENLNKQVSLYSVLLNLLSLENQALISNNHQKLIEATSEKELLTPNFLKLRNEMISLMKKIFFHEDKLTISLQEAINVSPAKYKDKLSKIKQTLNYQKQEIIMIKYRNQKLLETAMDYVKYMMSKMVEMYSNSQQVYSNNGEKGSLSDNDGWVNIVA
jgi:hypothetical protein